MRQPTILLVDDEQKLLDLVSFRLKFLGYQVITAKTGEEALLLAESEHPDLIILDIAMPGMDGVSVCARLRAAPTSATIPILMLTARSSVEDVNRAIAAGAEDYVVKPYDPLVLEGKLRRYLAADKIAAGARKGKT